MIEAWRRLAKAGTGQALIHQIAQAFMYEGRWPLFALAQRQGNRARLIVVSQGGTNLAVSDYALENAPCGLLYKQPLAEDTLVFCTNMRPFQGWPLLQQFDARSYVAKKVDVPANIGSFHIFLMDRVSRSERDIPRTMLATAAQRIAEDINHQAEKHELNALRQTVLHGSHASAIITPSGHLDYVSRGMAELMGLSIEEVNNQPLSSLISLDPKVNLSAALASNDTTELTTRIKINQQPQFMKIEITPLPVAIGHMITLAQVQQTLQEPQFDDQLLTHDQLADRLQQELARIHRNGQVAAILFVGLEGVSNVFDEQWTQLAAEFKELLRSEDLIAQLDQSNLAILTACFDHQGKAPRQQMNAIALKLYNQAKQWRSKHDFKNELRFKARLITCWDHDPDNILEQEKAANWSPNQIAAEATKGIKRNGLSFG